MASPEADWVGCKAEEPLWTNLYDKIIVAAAAEPTHAEADFLFRLLWAGLNAEGTLMILVHPSDPQYVAWRALVHLSPSQGARRACDLWRVLRSKRPWSADPYFAAQWLMDMLHQVRQPETGPFPILRALQAARRYGYSGQEAVEFAVHVLTGYC